MANPDHLQRLQGGVDHWNAWRRENPAAIPDLSDTDLRGADLADFDLRYANLTATELHNADLTRARFDDAADLLIGQLAGACVSGARLPRHIVRALPEALQVVEEATKNARQVLFLVGLACAYAALTILSTTDVRLLTNSASSPLPVIGTAIRIEMFYWVAPFFLLAAYLFLHVNLQRLWDRVAILPAVFPDGLPLDLKAYPWLLTGRVRAFTPRLKNRKPRFGPLQGVLSAMLVWWGVPLTLLLFWAGYLQRQEWIGTGFHIVWLVLAVGFGVAFHRSARATLQRHQEARPAGDNAGRHPRALLAVWSGTVVAVLMVAASAGAIHGAPSEWDDTDGSVHTCPLDAQRRPHVLRQLVPLLLDRIGFGVFADLEDEDVSARPADYFRLDVQESLNAVTGAHLERRSLRYARACRAFLPKADLRGANLAGANFDGAHLEQANLVNSLAHSTGRVTTFRGAFLNGARLDTANFAEVDLTGARLPGAVLINSNLAGATLRQADLTGAFLDSSVLEGALLAGAFLNGASLVDARLQRADLVGAYLNGATLTFANLSDADLSGAQLDDAILVNAILVGADLRAASLRGAQMIDSFLEGANLASADLAGAVLFDADLSRSILAGANLASANLASADLTGASLTEADLSGSILAGASLASADLSGVDLTLALGLTQAQLDVACGDERTQPPPGFTPPPPCP